MSNTTVNWVFLALLVAGALVGLVIWLINRLYRRSTKETAFIRTGWGGEKVIKGGGAFVLPIVHDTTLVNMNTLRLEVRRGQQSALITKNRMRVDVVAEFYVRVQASTEAIAAAAQTLGQRTMQPEALKELVEGKFVDALRSIAAEMTMEEMHERRGEYVQRVKSAVAEDLIKNGLELEAVSLTGMDQTNMEYFNPSNAFDAEGLTRLTEEIERRKKTRNAIEQDMMIEIRNKNLQAEKISLQIDRDSEYARLEQEREIASRRAEEDAVIACARAERERESEEAQLAARLEIERARIAQEAAIDERRIGREKATQALEVARRRELEEAEISAHETVERARTAADRALEEDRIGRERDTARHEIERTQAVEIAEQERAIAVAAKSGEKANAEAQAERAGILAELEVDRARLDRERTLDAVRIEREREIQALEVARRQSLDEAEIAAREIVERTRIATDRALDEARLVTDRDLRRLEIERQQALDIADIERSIAVAARTREQSEALIDAESVRARAVSAEEKVFSAREVEIAERRKQLEIIAAHQEAERESVRARFAAETEKFVAEDRAESVRLDAQGEAEAEKIRALAAKLTLEIEAEGRRQMNEATNVLTDEARRGEERLRLIDKLEGIIRESVKPMERIEGIKILQVDGLTPGPRAGGPGEASLPDHLVNSALRYRAQAPLVDALLREVGLAGGAELNQLNGTLDRSAEESADHDKPNG